MELFLLAGSWWLVGFSGAMMPGPVTTLIVTETTRRGFIAGPLITIGHVLLELAMVAGLFFGLGDVMKQNAVAGAIGIIGGIVLLWMGFDIARNAWQGRVTLNLTPTSPQSPSPSRRGEKGLAVRGAVSNPILGGVVTTIFNPYWLIWWATVGAAYLITFQAFGFAGIVAFYFGHTLADWVWNNVVALVVATGRRAMDNKIYRGILIICGAFMIFLSIYFVSSGLNFIRG